MVSGESDNLGFSPGSASASCVPQGVIHSAWEFALWPSLGGGGSHHCRRKALPIMCLQGST